MGFLPSSFARLKLVDWQHHTSTRFKICVYQKREWTNKLQFSGKCFPHVRSAPIDRLSHQRIMQIVTYLPTVCWSSWCKKRHARSQTLRGVKWNNKSSQGFKIPLEIGRFLPYWEAMAKRWSVALKMVLTRNVNLVSPKIGMKQGRWMGTSCVAHSIRQSTGRWDPTFVTERCLLGDEIPKNFPSFSPGRGGCRFE